MPRSEDVTYRWETLRGNPYVPSYTLKRYVGRTRKGELVEGWAGELNVQQDINRERWLYGIDMKQSLKGLRNPKKVRASGHGPTLEGAKASAEELLELLYEKPEVDADAFG